MALEMGEFEYADVIACLKHAQEHLGFALATVTGEFSTDERRPLPEEQMRRLREHGDEILQTLAAIRKYTHAEIGSTQPLPVQKVVQSEKRSSTL